MQQNVTTDVQNVCLVHALRRSSVITDQLLDQWYFAGFLIMMLLCLFFIRYEIKKNAELVLYLQNYKECEKIGNQLVLRMPEIIKIGLGLTELL